MKILQELKLKPNDRPKRKAFALEMLNHLEDDEDDLKKVIFTDEACFHASWKVNRHNVSIWGSENPHMVMEHIRDSPKVNVWCGLLHDRLLSPFFIAEDTVTSTIYMNMLEGFAFPHIEDLQPNIIFQQDDALPHWALVLRAILNEKFPGRWISQDGPTAWPPRSPEITPLDFFLWGFVKDVVYSTKVANLQELLFQITAACTLVDANMLSQTRQELVYSLDVLPATNGGAHIEMH